MSGTNTERSSLARLVRFRVCVSVAGGIVARAGAYAASLQQPATPANACNYMTDYDCRG